MVDLTTIVLAIAAFGPAFGLMLYTLQDYTFPRVEKPFFDDRKVFMIFILGLVVGMIFLFVDVAIAPSINNYTILVVALMVPIFQGMLKLIILNYPKLQRKVDTGFYGLALGLGIAATYAFSRMYFAAIDLESNDVLSIALIAMIGIQIVFIQGATTTIIGIGCARGQKWAYFANAMIYAIGFSLLFYGAALVQDTVSENAGIVLIILNWTIVLYSYWHIHTLDLPNLVEDARRGFRKRRR